MTTINYGYGASAAYTVGSSLAATNYDLTATSYNCTTNKPLDVLLDYVATVAANSTGNKQISLFVQASIDGATWPPLPSSTTDTTHDTSMIPLGAIQTNGGASSETARPPKPFSIATAFGYLPQYWRLVVKNDCGVAISSCSARTTEVVLTAS
jgi:hypothetical protein